MTKDFIKTGEECKRLLDSIESAEQVIAGLLDALEAVEDRSQSASGALILKELREIKLRVQRARTLFNTLPDAQNDLEQATLLLNKATDFLATIAARRKRD